MTALVALVTGASSGIGQAVARRLSEGGLTVFATVRNENARAAVESLGARGVLLDVTDESHRTQVVAGIQEQAGGIDVLVNNAGYALQKPVEQIEIDEFRQQFDTNVLAPVRLSQLVLPGMRRRGGGRIINVSSMGGRLVLPGGGAYHASKYALEAFSDALRLEVSSFGVRVVLVEPGVVQSEFGSAAKTAASSAPGLGRESAEANVDDRELAYERFNAELVRALALAYSGRKKKSDPSPEDVADVIHRAATTRSPRARYVVGARARFLVNSRRFLPDAVWDAQLRKAWPSN